MAQHWVAQCANFRRAIITCAGPASDSRIALPRVAVGCRAGETSLSRQLLFRRFGKGGKTLFLMSGSLAAELEGLRGSYRKTLEAIQHQNLVIAQLERLLWTKQSVRGLYRDAAIQTDPVGGGDAAEHEVLFLTVIRLRLQIHREQRRCQEFREHAQGHLVQLEEALQVLRRRAVDAVPAGAHVSAILAGGGVAGGAPATLANVPTSLDG